MKNTFKPIVRLLTRPRLLVSRDNIFLFSHMRANTSVLSHILGSHPEIEGYYEMHMDYHNLKSLWHHKLTYLQDHAPKTTSHFFFDKLLHNYCSVVPGILHSPNTKVILMLRDPEQSIKSIVNLYLNKKNSHEYSDPELATLYYLERLNYLTALSEEILDAYYYLDAESITETPLPALSSLGAWLGLRAPLKTEYTLFSKTGKEKMGDSSEYIKLGKISEKRHDYGNIHIPPSLLQEANQNHIKCRSKIVQNSCAKFVIDPEITQFSANHSERR